MLYQAWVIDKCGISLEKIFIVYHGEDESAPFVPMDVTEEARAFSKVVDENLEKLTQVRNSRAEICMKPGEQCSDPYECWYWDVCH